MSRTTTHKNSTGTGHRGLQTDHNARKNSSSTADLDKRMQSMSLKEKGTKRDSTTSTAKKQETSARHPKKADVWGDFVQISSGKASRSTLQATYMASVPSASGTQNPAGSHSRTFVQADAVGQGLRVVSKIAFGMPGQPSAVGIIDSGAGFVLADKSLFDGEELKKAEVKDDKGAKEIDFTFPNSPHGKITGSLHQLDVVSGASKLVMTKNQRFYVTDNELLKGNAKVLYGIGPEQPHLRRTNHSSADVPGILDNVVVQYGLPRILSIYISGWNDESKRFPFTGHVDFGGFDTALCKDFSSADWVKRSDDPVVRSYYGVDSTLTYGDGRSPEQLMPDDGQGRAIISPVTGILDTGAPGIGFSQRMFKTWVDILQRGGITFEEHREHTHIWLQITKESLPKLKSLVFKFDSKEGKRFTVKIPADRLIYPSRIARTRSFAKESHLIMVTHLATQQHDFTLGIPFFQERYAIVDMRESQHYIGFVKILGQTEGKSAELDKIRAQLKESEKREKKDDKKDGKDSKGKRKAVDGGQAENQTGKKRIQ